MITLLRVAKWLAVLLVVIGVADRIWPALPSGGIWRACAWGSLIASSLAALSHFPQLFLGWLAAAPGRGRIKRLAKVDFGSRVSSIRRLLYAVPLTAAVLAAAWRLDLSIYAAALVAPFLAPEIYFLTLRMTPPLVLYLGASEPRDPLRSASLMSVVLVGRRLMTMLRPGQHDIGPSYTRILSYRARDDRWIPTLDEMLELATLVALDLRTDTDAVRFELDRVVAGHHVYKTVVLAEVDLLERYESALRPVTGAGGVCVTTFDGLSYVLRAFCHPRMPPPTVERPIAALVGDIRRENPGVDFAVWGQPIPPPRGDTIPGRRHRVF